MPLTLHRVVLSQVWRVGIGRESFPGLNPGLLSSHSYLSLCLFLGIICPVWRPHLAVSSKKGGILFLLDTSVSPLLHDRCSGSSYQMNGWRPGLLLYTRWPCKVTVSQMVKLWLELQCPISQSSALSTTSCFVEAYLEAKKWKIKHFVNSVLVLTLSSRSCPPLTRASLKDQETTSTMSYPVSPSKALPLLLSHSGSYHLLPWQLPWPSLVLPFLCHQRFICYIP